MGQVVPSRLNVKAKTGTVHCDFPLEHICPFPPNIPILSCVVWMERTQKLQLQIWLLKKTSVVHLWAENRGLNWHRLVGALGLKHTQLWVPDACYPVLMWLLCETMASTILYKGPRLWWFGKYSHWEKFQWVRTNLQTSSSEWLR